MHQHVLGLCNLPQFFLEGQGMLHQDQVLVFLENHLYNLGKALFEVKVISPLATYVKSFGGFWSFRGSFYISGSFHIKGGVIYAA